MQKAIKAEQEKDEDGGAEKTTEENDDKTSENDDVKMSEEKVDDKPSDDKPSDDIVKVFDEKKEDTKAEVMMRRYVSCYVALTKSILK